MFFLVLALQAANPVNTTDPVQRHTNCVGDMASSLEISGEPATTIAQVSIAKCRSLESAAIDELIAHARKKAKSAGFNLDVPASELHKDIGDDLRRTSYDFALQLVTEIRAERQARKNQD